MEDLVFWLELKSLLDVFSEFYGKNVYDGMVFDDQVGCVFFGMNYSLVGQCKIVVWVDDMQVIESNLLWWVMVFNQVDVMCEFDVYLKEVSVYNDKQVLVFSFGWDIVF